MDARNRRERVIAEAAEWWVALQDHLSRTQREQFVDWLRESVLHVAEMLRVAQLHGALEQFESWAKIPANATGSDAGTVVSLSRDEPGRSGRSQST